MFGKKLATLAVLATMVTASGVPVLAAGRHMAAHY